MASVSMMKWMLVAGLLAVALAQEVPPRSAEADLVEREGEEGAPQDDQGPPPLDGEGPFNGTEEGEEGPPFPHPPPPTGPPQYKACHVDATPEELFYPNRKTVACFMMLDAFEILHDQLPPITPESDPVEDKIKADKNSCETVVNVLNTILGEDEAKQSECCDLRCWCTDLKEESYKDEDSKVCQGRIFVPEYNPEEGPEGEGAPEGAPEGESPEGDETPQAAGEDEAQ